MAQFEIALKLVFCFIKNWSKAHHMGRLDWVVMLPHKLDFTWYTFACADIFFLFCIITVFQSIIYFLLLLYRLFWISYKSHEATPAIFLQFVYRFRNGHENASVGAPANVSSSMESYCRSNIMYVYSNSLQ